MCLQNSSVFAHHIDKSCCFSKNSIIMERNDMLAVVVIVLLRFFSCFHVKQVHSSGLNILYRLTSECYSQYIDDDVMRYYSVRWTTFRMIKSQFKTFWVWTLALNFKQNPERRFKEKLNAAHWLFAVSHSP